ncbi:MAG TPA: fumarylacetoacetate hydrolase family protein [Tepidisphaeraceae bacterium]|jgi:fumarylacetoacetate (FAA) hydrolase|nr:fumarylacetoacetate hydrolase family protein [Tepidisphaeraceae bacterium]
MRLATVYDAVRRSSLPVIELASGRVPLRDLAGSKDVPAYLGELGQAVAHLGEIRAVAARWKGEPLAALERFALSVPVPNPRAFRDFYAFEQHVKTCRAQRGLGMNPAWYEQPVFYFSNPSSLVGHDAPVFAPAGSVELDYELELGVVIGQGGRDIAPEAAWSHVAGFTIINDFSARDLQRREMAVGLGPAKGKDFATAVGPCLVTLDEFADRIDSDGTLHLQMTACVNGRELSRGNAADMYYKWPAIIAQASRDAELFPGDLLGSGTVGTGCILEIGPDAAGGWLKPGDVVELEIERIGILRTPIVARPTAAQ